MLKKLTDKFSVGKMLFIFNFVLIAGGGGTLYMMRVSADDYAPVPLDPEHLLPVGFAAAVILLVFSGMVLCLDYLKRLQNLGAVLVMVCFLEIVLFGYGAWHIFTEAARDHRAEERQQLDELVTKLNKDATTEHKDYLMFSSVILKGPLMRVQYKIPDSGIYIARENFIKEACGYLGQYSKYKSLTGVAYVFSSSNGKANILAFGLNDCKNADSAVAETAAPPAAPLSAPIAVPVPVVVATPIAARLPAPVNRAPLMTNDAFDRGLDALSLRIDGMQNTVDQRNRLLGQMLGTVPHPSFSSAQPWQAKIDRIDQQLAALKHKKIGASSQQIAPAAPKTYPDLVSPIEPDQ